MTQESIEDWERIYKELTDPEEREKAKQTTERKERLQDKIKDTGL